MQGVGDAFRHRREALLWRRRRLEWRMLERPRRKNASTNTQFESKRPGHVIFKVFSEFRQWESEEIHAT
jgi:hypothetical protein